MSAVPVNLTGKIYTGISMAAVRSRPSVSGSIIDRLTDNTEVVITQQDGNWYYLNNIGGWIPSSYVLIDNDENDTDKVTNISKEDQEEAVKKLKLENDNQLDSYETYINENAFSDKEIADSFIVSNLNGIYGIPYQFMPSVDPRINGSIMGRKYSEKIITKMPLLCITPGKVEFMSNYSKSEKKGVLASLISGGSETDINNIIKNNGRYYTFAFAYDDYFNYVNGLCRTGAKFLDIHNVPINIGGTTAKASAFDWKLALNKNLKATLTSQEFIGFYMDSTDSVTESFGNDTTQSQLASTVNGFSDLAKEVGFLLGAGAQDITNFIDKTGIDSAMAAIDEIGKKYLGNSPLLSNIASNFQTVAIGGKLLFPEIWSDSTFSRNFDINIKLRTPDADVVSWYLNIYVPLCHLIALAAGHQTDNVNGYYSPFLVRAYYKGLFNVDMGIVTDMSITKGKEAAWSIDGLPTEIDVSITIKDLYNMLSIVPGDEPKNFVTNNILMDYIANTCGININQMDIERSLHIYYILSRDKVKDIPNRTIRRFQDAIDTYAMDLYNKSMNKFLL